jgi:hypothetical protein
LNQDWDLSLMLLKKFETCTCVLNPFQNQEREICLAVAYYTRGNIVVKALCYKPEGRGFNTRWGEFLNVPNLSGAALDPGVYSAAYRNEYQKHKNNNVSGE